MFRNIPYFKRKKLLKIAHFQKELCKLRKTEVFDVNYEKLGTITDFIFNKQFELTDLEVSSSKLAKLSTRFLSKFGTRYYIDVYELKKEDKILVVSYKNAKLASQYNFEDSIFFSKIKNKYVFDSNGEKIGRIIDAIIHIDYKTSFILGGSYLEEILEDIGIISDMDIFLPTNILIHQDEKGNFHAKYEKKFFKQKSTRPDIIRGTSFDRFPGEKRNVFYKMKIKIHKLEKQLELINDKIDSSPIANQITIKNLDHSNYEMFINLHDEIFFASPDPIRGLTKDEVKFFEEDSTFIIWLHNKPIGFVYLPVFIGIEGIKEGSIAGIGVLSNQRGKKVSFILIKYALQFFKEHSVESVTCEVFEKNEPSRTMFEKLGFEIYDHMVLQK